MKLITHNIVGLGVSALASTIAGCSFSCIIASCLSGVIVQNVIDLLSHERRGGYTRRTKLLHSVEGVTLLSVALTMLVAGALGLGGRDVVGLLVAIELASLSHLVLDSLTPAGVYVLGRRVAIARIPYDNPEVNVIAQALGLLALAAAVLEHIP